jgi:hypothetical protein
MVEADSHLKLLPTSMLTIFKVLEHIDMLSIVAYGSSLTQLYSSNLIIINLKKLQSTLLTEIADVKSFVMPYLMYSMAA